ncbi:hypothetical protein D3C84_1175530 [compost metagenome]
MDNAQPIHRSLYCQVHRAADAHDQRAARVDAHRFSVTFIFPQGQGAAGKLARQAGMPKQVPRMFGAAPGVEVGR